MDTKKPAAKAPEQRRGYKIVAPFEIDGRKQLPAQPGSNPIILQMTPSEAKPWLAIGVIVAV